MSGDSPVEVAARWDAVASGYEQPRYWCAPENHANLYWLLHEIGDPRGKSVIEVGCGSGFMSLALAKRGATCSLLDISPRSLELATASFSAAGLRPPPCYLEDALRSSVLAESFDVVWNGGVIEHFVDAEKERLLQEMLRMAKPGGLVVVLVPNAWCWPFRLKQALLKARGRWAYGFEDDLSPRRLRRLCKRIGVTTETVYAFNPILGWCWYSKLRWLIARVGWNTPELHRRRSWMGFVSVVAIRKESACQS
jgi:2-polyprenyl-3-methyl-5-hydroxy-6-metoxy-1,4-benzoquinol methylase